VAGDARLSLSLAAALVRMARMAGATPAAPLPTYFLGDRSFLGVSSFLGDSREISARVDRLLSPAPAAPMQRRNSAVLAAGLALAAGCSAGMLHPATLERAHRIFEQLIH
jgi:hypothetical protein